MAKSVRQPTLALEMLDHRLGDRQAVEGARAPAHLVEDHEASRRGPVEDPGSLRHLDQKRARPAGEVVARPDPGEEAVDDAEPAPPGRHETAGLGQHGQQRRLADEGALAAHVGAGDQQDRRAAVGRGADWSGGRAARARSLATTAPGGSISSSTGWRPASISSSPPAVISGFTQPRRRATSAKADEHVEDRQDPRCPVEPGPLAGHEPPQLVEQIDLAADGLLLGAEHLPLPLVEFRRRVPLGVLDRLLANVFRRHLVGLRRG